LRIVAELTAKARLPASDLELTGSAVAT